MNNWPPAPKGTYYYIADELEKNHKRTMIAHEYSWEEVDGKPRYRWYKYALNSVHLIESCDNNHDIDRQDFSDLISYYEAVEWVAQKDPLALEYIMAELTAPVVQIVKDKLLFHLTQLEFFSGAQIVQKHLRSFPVPPERTFNRRQEKAVNNVQSNIVKNAIDRSNQLEKYRKEIPEKLLSEDVEMTNAFSLILSLDFRGGQETYKSCKDDLHWMLENDCDNLKQLCTIQIYAEIKDHLLNILITNEDYKLHIFFNDLIKVIPCDDYYNIKPYKPDPDDEEDWYDSGYDDEEYGDD